ncbi:ASCH domain-containing protein [Luteipulveratus mongoliensis]|uniref:ASCH domain-containing protein n=1 Tax=Luteipulveratus mongoliensis TaxID=571913 RepID=UPI000695D587|nr:ASCH domain-containing protein [Luteipulveratus mongoliensis]
MIDIDRAAVERFWAAFCAHRGKDLPVPTAETFGDSPEMADELLGLVLDGTKRATASAHDSYAPAGEDLPQVADRWIPCDGKGIPRCVLETTDVRVGPLDSVDDQFAWDEGEGDRSRAYWLSEHQGFFERTAAGDGFTYSESMPTVFERFAVVWPPELADSPR